MLESSLLCSGLSTADKKGKGASDSCFGPDSDLAAMELGELSGDEEAEATASILCVCAWSGLGEAPKQFLLFLSGQTAACVLYLELEVQ